jgi:hypothetical protein
MNEAITATEKAIAILMHMGHFICVGLIGKMDGVALIKTLADYFLIFVAAVIWTFNKFIFVFSSHTIPPLYVLKSSTREHLPKTKHGYHYKSY